MYIKDELVAIFGPDNPFVSVILLLVAIATAVVFHIIIFLLLNRLNKRYKHDDLKLIARKIRMPVFLLLLVLALTMTMPLLEVGKGIAGLLQHFLSILIIATIAWMLIQAVSMSRIIILNRYDLETADNLKARKVYTQFRVLERIIIVLIILIAVGTALMTFEKIRQVGVSLLASAGIAGIILGFAAQRAIATILAGFQIAMTQPIRIEDVVIVEGEWGRIEEIFLTYVVIRIWDKRRLIVPTTYFIEKPFQNWTRVSAEILGTVYIHTDYTIPFDALREELTKLLKASGKWDGEVDVLQVTNATEKTVEVRALMSAPDSGTAWDLRVYVREGLIRFLQDKYPQSLPRTRVELDKPDGNDTPGAIPV